MECSNVKILNATKNMMEAMELEDFALIHVEDLILLSRMTLLR